MNSAYAEKLAESAEEVYKRIQSFACKYKISECEAAELFKIAVLADIKTELFGIQASIEELY